YKDLGQWAFGQEYHDIYQAIADHRCKYCHERAYDHHLHYLFIEDPKLRLPAPESKTDPEPEGWPEDTPSWTPVKAELWTDKLGTEYWRPVSEESVKTQHEVNALETQEPDVEDVWAEGDQRMFPTLEAKEVGTPVIDQESLTLSEVKSLQKLLYEFTDLFASDLKDRPRCTVVQHKIETGDATPIRCHKYNYSPQGEQIISEEVQRMLEAGIIRPSSSPWCFPVVLVKKKNGKTRVCNDYRRLNQVTKLDSYPLPLIQEIFDALHGAQFFSTLDCTSGYWQIEVFPAHQEKTAFVTKDGIFEYVVMPFGLTNAPATYQRAMNTILRDLLWKNTLDFLDDVCIFTKTTFADHLQDLRQVFTKLREANLVLNPEKCYFGRQELPLLGHIISRKGLRVDPAKVEKLVNMRPPRTVTEIQSVVGLGSYYWNFIQDFAKIVQPMTRMTRKDVPLVWNEVAQASFDQLKKALTNAPVLAFPDPQRPFILHTDGSSQGLGAILSQVGPDGKEHIIHYASHTLKSSQASYAPTHLEALAVIWAINKFRNYVWGREFTLRTDHSALVSVLQGTKQLTGMLARWAAFLQEYRYKAEHVKGKHNPADAPSRLVNAIEEAPNNLPLLRKYLETEELPNDAIGRRRIKH